MMGNRIQEQVYINSAIYLFSYAVLSLYALAPEESRDIFWHLKMGQDWIQNGLSPFIDHYSFTNYGDAISPVPVIFQVSVAYLVILLGEQYGLYAFKLIYIFLIMMTLAVYLKKIKATSLVVFFIVPLISYFVAHRLLLRPELISNVLMLVAMILYVRARKSFDYKELTLISILLLVWVNYHSPVFGYIIIFGLFLDRFIHKCISSEKTYSWKFFIIWGIIIFSIGFLNREGEHFIFGMLEFIISDKGVMTLEYLPSKTFYASNIMVHISWVLSIYAFIWSVIKKHYGLAFISILLLFFSWNTARLVTPVAMVNICVLALLVSEYVRNKEYLNLKIDYKYALISLMVIVSLLSSYKLISISLKEVKYINERDSRREVRFPVYVTSYLSKHQTGGKILNPMSTGGYLLNKLSPNFKVYLDGRTNILYPNERLNHYLEVISSSEIMKKEIELYDVDYVLLANRPWLISLVYNKKGMTLNYADEYYMLYSKIEAKNKFPISSLMSIVPACWDNNFIDDVKREHELANKIFNDDVYLIKSMLNILSAYNNSSNKEMFIKKQLEIKLMPDNLRRMLGYLAIKNKMYNVSLEYFKDIRSVESNDTLISAYALAKSGRYRDAEKTLLIFTNSHYFYFMPNIESAMEARKIWPYQTDIILKIVDTIKKSHEVEFFTGSEFESLKEAHNDSDASVKKTNDVFDPLNKICYALTNNVREVSK